MQEPGSASCALMDRENRTTSLMQDLQISFDAILQDQANKLIGHEEIHSEFERQLRYVYADCQESLRRGEIFINEKKVALASALGVRAAGAGVQLDQLVRAWSGMFEVFLLDLHRVAGNIGTAQGLNLLVTAVHRSIAERSRVASMWYETALNQRLERVQAAERRRMSRELHDWYGTNLSLALRKLELVEVRDRAGDAHEHLAGLRTVLNELFEGTRRFASGLRLQDPVGDITRALRSYADSAGGAMDVDVFVRGDETAMPAQIGSETFVVLREALRNIFTHSGGTKAFVMVEISPDRVCAVVQDNGRGFEAPADLAELGGSGVLSMRERVEQLGGMFVLTSEPRRGTRIEIWVPLTRRAGEQLAG
jgi:signal transduction histidine kinase